MSRSIRFSLGLALGTLALFGSQAVAVAHAQDVDTDVQAAEVAAAPVADYQLVFLDDQQGGALFDMAPFAGRSTISAEELRAGHPIVHTDFAQTIDGCQ